MHRSSFLHLHRICIFLWLYLCYSMITFIVMILYIVDLFFLPVVCISVMFLCTHSIWIFFIVSYPLDTIFIMYISLPSDVFSWFTSSSFIYRLCFFLDFLIVILWLSLSSLAPFGFSLGISFYFSNLFYCISYVLCSFLYYFTLLFLIRIARYWNGHFIIFFRDFLYHIFDPVSVFKCRSY